MEITRAQVKKMAGETIDALRHFRVKATSDLKMHFNNREHLRYRCPRGSVHFHYRESPQTRETAYMVERDYGIGPPPISIEINRRRLYSRITIRCSSPLPGYSHGPNSQSSNLRQVRELGPSVNEVVSELERLVRMNDTDYGDPAVETSRLEEMEKQ